MELVVILALEIWKSCIRYLSLQSSDAFISKFAHCTIFVLCAFFNWDIFDLFKILEPNFFAVVHVCVRYRLHWKTLVWLIALLNCPELFFFQVLWELVHHLSVVTYQFMEYEGPVVCTRRFPWNTAYQPWWKFFLRKVCFEWDLYRQFEGHDCESFLALLKFNVSSHLKTYLLAAGQPYSNVVILGLGNANSILELLKRYKEDFLPISSDAYTRINNLGLKNMLMLSNIKGFVHFWGPI